MFNWTGHLFNRYRYTLPDRSIKDLKEICKILFIDDLKFDVPDILINSGWKNTKIVVDIESLYCSEVKEANIIFVDISGVGRKMKFSDEGLGLISALKEKYPEKKIVVYSSQSRGDRFHKGLSDADARLAKNADPYQFENIVEQFAKEAFSRIECIKKLREEIYNQFGIYMTEPEIDEKLLKIGQKRDYSILKISKIFNLENASSIASIASLFLRGS